MGLLSVAFVLGIAALIGRPLVFVVEFLRIALVGWQRMRDLLDSCGEVVNIVRGLVYNYITLMGL